MVASFQVVFEDLDLLVVNKPAGLVCHPTKPDGRSSLISQIRSVLGPDATPHLVNRLDRETSGLVIVAKNRETAAQLQKIWENGRVQKEYQAIVHGWIPEERTLIEAPLGRDEASAVAIKDCVREDGSSAQTEFWVIKRFLKGGREFSLLRVVPRTGRKHQIRIHLAYCGHPIVGDKIYGGNESRYLAFVKGLLTPADWKELVLPFHALHACEIRMPYGGGETRFCAEPEIWFSDFHSSALDS